MQNGMRDCDDLGSIYHYLFSSTFFKKAVDEWEIYGIIYVSAKNTQSVVLEAQFTTGGRLGVIQCLV